MRLLFANQIDRRLPILLAIAATLNACSPTYLHQTDTFFDSSYGDYSGAQTLSVDAKQRVVVLSRVKTTTTDEDKDNKTKKETKYERPIICTEPSPDALSAISSSISGAAQKDPSLLLRLAIANTESAASIGLRTQSIQLLRDGMYRLCEGYASGALDHKEFNRLQRRYQNLMLSLLAIEQITGATVARQASLGGGSSSSSVGVNSDLATQNMIQADKEQADANQAYGAAVKSQNGNLTACKATPPDEDACSKKDSDAQTVATKQLALNAAIDKQTTARVALEASRNALMASSSGASVQLHDSAKGGLQPSDASTRYVAESARAIVATTLLASFNQEECGRLWDLIEGNIGSVNQLINQGVSDNGKKPPSVDNNKNVFSILSKAIDSPDKSGDDKGKEIATKISTDLLSILSKLASSCNNNILSNSQYLIPDYGAAIPPLKVLGGEDVTLIPGKSIRLPIIGGKSPYDVKATAEVSELKISLSGSEKDSLLVERPDKAKLDNTKINIFVLDASGANISVPVNLAQPKVVENPSIEGATTPTIKDIKSDRGHIIVTYSAAAWSNKSRKVVDYTATAVNKATPKEVHIAVGSSDATSIDIAPCNGGQDYDVTIQARNDASEILTSKSKPISCSTSKPEAPKDVRTSSTGGNISIDYSPAQDGGDTITSYTATATNTKADKSKDKLVEKGLNKPLLIKGCTPDEPYSVSILATNGNGDGPPTKATPDIKCVK